VNFLSAIEAAQFRASRNGCGSSGEMASATVTDAQMQCTDYCGKKAGAYPAKLCGMTHVLHDTGERLSLLGLRFGFATMHFGFFIARVESAMLDPGWDRREGHRAP
jgi:hypothetical protein